MYALPCLRDRRWSVMSSAFVALCTASLGLLALPASAQERIKDVSLNPKDVVPTYVELMPDQQSVVLPHEVILGIATPKESISAIGSPRRGVSSRGANEVYYQAPADLSVRNPDSFSYQTSDGMLGQIHFLRRPIGIVEIDENFDSGFMNPSLGFVGPRGHVRVYSSGNADLAEMDPTDYELLIHGHETEMVAIDWGAMGGGDTSGSRTNFGVDPRNPTTPSTLVPMEVAMALDVLDQPIWKVALPPADSEDALRLEIFDEAGHSIGNLSMEDIETRYGVEVAYWPSSADDVRDGRIILTSSSGKTQTLGHLDVGTRPAKRVLFGVLNPSSLSLSASFDDIRFESEVPRPVVMPAFSDGFEDSIPLWRQKSGGADVTSAAALAGSRGLELNVDGPLTPGAFVRRIFASNFDDGFELRFLIDASLLTMARGNSVRLIEASCDDGTMCMGMDLVKRRTGFHACVYDEWRSTSAYGSCVFLGTDARRVSLRRRAGTAEGDRELAISVDDGTWHRHSEGLVGSGRLKHLKIGIWSTTNRAIGTVYLDELEVLR